MSAKPAAKRKTRYRPCSIVETDCLAPPVLDDSYTGNTCYACGESVCLNCSVLREWNRKAGRRVCGKCNDESPLVEIPV